jgi:hypothetical protein
VTYYVKIFFAKNQVKNCVPALQNHNQSSINFNMEKISKDQMKFIFGGLLADGCTATATCSDGSKVTISGTGTGSNCTATDYTNTQDGKGQACYHPLNGNSQCNTCSK